MTFPRAALRTALVLGLSLTPLLAGCTGFTPLYGDRATVTGLSTIDVVAPSGRTGYLLRESLDDALGRDPRATPVYRLTYGLEELRNPRGLGADNAASRYELSVKVKYQLVEIASEKTVKDGETEVLITYGAIDAPYAGIAAQNASEERAANEAAQRIRLDLAQFFATRAG
jgi:LPS-assembly lipoprotein